MSKEIWHKKLESIEFYISSFRHATVFLTISIVINLAFGAGIYYQYFNRGDRAFYASNGVVAPIPLTARDKPNFSSKAILAPSPSEIQNTDSKPIPE